MTLSVRPFVQTDREAVLDLIDQLNRHEDAISGDRATGLSVAEVCLARNGQLIALDGGRAFVAEETGRVIGYVLVVMDEGDPYIRAEHLPMAVVEELVVAQEARGRGVGTFLLDQAERAARAMGARRLTIGAIVGNSNALRAYERFGFVPDVLQMKKDLA